MIRLGSTSFIFPDHMVPNVERLAARVDDVELLLFSVDEDLPGGEDVAALQRLKLENELSYTIHTPLDASLASADEARRAAGVDKVRRAIAWGRPLAPFGYTVHVYLGDQEHDPSPPRDLDAWRERARRSLESLVGDGLAPADLCVECIDYDFELIAPVVRDLGLSVALDVGHLMRDGIALLPVVDRWLSKTRIFQVHGTRPDGRDHKSLAYAPRAELSSLVQTLRARSWRGVFTVEVFDPADLDESLAILRTENVGRDDRADEK
ncbi:MAG: putative Xylose isomerase domain protein barrel [Myxococcales bacterium]|nr:putative Xylose isomerase domain protein barrel [Myxococcales bacterium]